MTVRIAILSLHTSPLQQPGEGDAGGLNVYVVQLARQLAVQGSEVDIFTADRREGLPDVVEIHAGVRVHQLSPPIRLAAVPEAFRGGASEMSKESLAGHTLALTRELIRHPAIVAADVIHSHYWISGWVGLHVREALIAAGEGRLGGIPLVHTMHTMGKVKNRDLGVSPDAAALPSGFRPEPDERIRGEEHLVAAADRLIANTPREAQELIQLYGADPDKVTVAAPGVDHEVFRPGDREAARRCLGMEAGSVDLLALFVGRIQYLKGPDVLIEAVEALKQKDPALAGRLTVAVLGGSSGADGGLERIRRHVAEHGLTVTFRAPVPAAVLSCWYRASDVVVVPSRSESFGLVAAEAGACATPVIAADVGGLRDLVDDGATGLLVSGHDPRDWAEALGFLLADDARRLRMGRAGVEHIARFSWEKTAARTVSVYRLAMRGRTRAAECCGT